MSTAQEALLLCTVSLAGGAIPLVFRHSDRLLHLLIALATGIFLGTIFLHMLPQVAELAEHWPVAESTAAASEIDAGATPIVASAEFESHESHGTSLWLFVLIGVMALFVLENLVVNRRNLQERHVAVGYASLLGLSLHSLTSGFSLAATAQMPTLATPVFVSIISHKAAESFSLASVFLLAGFSRRRTLTLLCLFSLVTPAGLLFGSLILAHIYASMVAALTALAVGTFLIVALYDLLPEVFHHRVDAGKKILLVVAGIGLTMWMHR